MAQPSKTADALIPSSPAPNSGPAASDGLADLYRRYADWLRALLRRRYGADAEDLVQETYIRIAPYHAASKVRHPQALLLRIADNLARDRLRREAKDRRIRALLEEAAVGLAPAAQANQLEALLFKQVLLGLAPIYRDVMILSRFSGLTNREIAERLGLSVKTVEWRLTKAVALCVQQTSDTASGP